MDDERIRWARALSFTGWMFVAAYVAYVVQQIRRAFAIREASFEDGLWWQRVEQISFISQPQNLIILVPAAAAATVGSVLVRRVVDPSVMSLATIVRVVAGLCYFVIAMAALGIVGIFFRNPDGVGDLTAVFLRLGGVLMSAGMLRLCFETERTR